MFDLMRQALQAHYAELPDPHEVDQMRRAQEQPEMVRAKPAQGAGTPSAQVGNVQVAGQDYPMEVAGMDVPVEGDKTVEGMTIPVPRATAQIGKVSDVTPKKKAPRTLPLQKAFELMGEEGMAEHYPGIFDSMGHLPYTRLGKTGELEVIHPADVLKGTSPIRNHPDKDKPKMASDE